VFRKTHSFPFGGTPANRPPHRPVEARSRDGGRGAAPGWVFSASLPITGQTLTFSAGSMPKTRLDAPAITGCSLLCSNRSDHCPTFMGVAFQIVFSLRRGSFSWWIAALRGERWVRAGPLHVPGRSFLYLSLVVIGFRPPHVSPLPARAVEHRVPVFALNLCLFPP